MTADLKHVLTRAGNIAYAERGAGPVALFVHGVFLNHHLWRHIVDAVADMRRCIAIDLLAHGETEISLDQRVDFTAEAEMLEEVCAALELERWTSSQMTAVAASPRFLRPIIQSASEH